MKISLIFKSISFLMVSWAVFMMNPDWPIWGDGEYIDYHGMTIWNQPRELTSLIKNNVYSDPLLVPSLIALVCLYVTTLLVFVSVVVSLVLLIRKRSMPILLDITSLLFVAVSGTMATIYFYQVMDHGNPYSMAYSVFPAIAAVLCAIPLIMRLAMRKKEN